MLKVESVLRDKEYLIFDLDDTLIDSYQNHKQGIWEIVKEYDVHSNIYQKLLQEMEEHGRNRVSRRSLYNLFINHDAEEIDRVYWRGVGRFILAYEDAINFVNFCTQMLGKKMSILSNGGEVQQKKFDLVKEIFGDVFRPMIYTGQYGRGFYKPDTGCLNILAKELFGENPSKQDKKKMVYIGDRLDTDYEMCKSYEIDFILIDRKNEIKEKTDCLKISSFEELICIQ